MYLVLIPKGQGKMKSWIKKGLAGRKAYVLSYGSSQEAVKYILNRQVGVLIVPAEMKNEQLMPLVSLAGNQECHIPIVYLVPPKMSGNLKNYVLKTGFDFISLPWENSRDRLNIAVRNALVDRQSKESITYREQELAILDEVGKIIISTLELKKVLNIIMQKTKELVRAEAWSLLLVDEKNEELLFSVAIGQHSEKLREFKLKIGQGIAGWVAKEGKPIIVQNVMDDHRFFNEIDQQIEFKTRSVMCVPLESRGKVLGVIEVINKMENNFFTDRDLALVTKLAGFAAIAIDNARLYHQTKMMGLTDELTKLYNSRFFNHFLDSEIKRSERYKGRVSLIFLDLDYFKLVNDKYGHLIGSRVLVEVARILKRGLREVDVVARYGGDEFLIILPETPIEDAGRVAERIRQDIENNEFLKQDNLNIKLTASFGVSCYPDCAKSKDDLIRKADQAMYRVKNMNRNGVWMADGKDSESEGKIYQELS